MSPGWFSAWRLEPSLQGLWRSSTRLLASWGFGTRIVGKPAPVASDFDWVPSPVVTVSVHFLIGV